MVHFYGFFHMQVRYSTKLSLQEYIEQEAWNQAHLDHCPLHPGGGCGLARHGTYAGKFPEYCLIARHYGSSAFSVDLI